MATKLQLLAKTNDFQVIMVLLPEKNDVENGYYKYDFEQLKSNISKFPNLHFTDLLPSYQNYSKSEPRPPLSYYWTIVGHHNSDGYQVMAQCISDF